MEKYVIIKNEVMTMYDIIIVGSGVAGMTAAIYSKRAGKKVLVLEAKNYGGQIVRSPKVENYPGFKAITGFDLAHSLYQQMIALEVDFRLEKVISIEKDKVITKDNEYFSKAIILAVGTENKMLGLKNEKELIGRGVSYCATCDGPLYKGKTVAIIGGGNTGLEDAIFLSDYCRFVYLIHRRDEFRGEQKYVDILQQKENVKILLNTKVEEIQGENQVTGIKVYHQDTKQEEELMIQGLFIAIGQVPSTDFLKNYIQLDKYHYIIAKEDMKTNIENIFVAGDCREKKIRQLTTAVSDGTIASLMACEYLHKKGN